MSVDILSRNVGWLGYFGVDTLKRSLIVHVRFAYSPL